MGWLGVIERLAYRPRQLLTALRGKVSSEEMADARRVLGNNLYAIFAPLPRPYRRHAINVYRRVVSAGCSDTAVLQAALLHDAGKYDPTSGHYVTVLHRISVVLLDALPGGKRLLGWLAVPRRRDALFYPFYLSVHHPMLGAKLAASHGASDAVVSLIANHQRRGAGSAELSVLQAADDSS